MIPIMGSETKNSRLVSYSNLTYRLGDESIEGKTEGIEAIKQAIYKILLTERFEYEIYDDNYDENIIFLRPHHTKPRIKKLIFSSIFMRLDF